MQISAFQTAAAGIVLVGTGFLYYRPNAAFGAFNHLQKPET